MNDKPLSGITVLDLSHVVSGPFCTLHLADNGARVIKVEREKGDDARFFGPFYDNAKSAYFHAINRGKESIRLNLKKAEDFKLLERILKKADVLVENFRPGTLEKLGLAPKQLLKKYSKLIVCSISGYGQTGPLAHAPAYDTVVQGVSGAMSFTGARNPTRIPSPLCDISAGLYAFGAICAALAGRARTGKGTWIDISMLDSVWTFLESGLLSVLAKGKDLLTVGNRHPTIAPFDTFLCQDKPITLCCANDALFLKLTDALALPALKNDARFATNAARVANQDALKPAIEAVLKTRCADEWLAVLTQAGIPSGPVNTIAEAAFNPQIAEREMIAQSGGNPVCGTPFKYDTYDSHIAPKPAPDLDADGAALRREFSE